MGDDPPVAPFSAVPPAVRRNMQANRGRDTQPEMVVRKLLHARGLRFRVTQPLTVNRRRRADLTFTRVSLHVFIDGCFWHGCPEHFVAPKTNDEFWRTKIAMNKERDAETNELLVAAGFRVLRFWEHEDPNEVAVTIEREYRRLSLDSER